MDAFRLDVENAAMAAQRAPTGLLGDPGQGVGLVQQAQLAFGLLLCRWVQEHTAFEQRAMKVSHQ